MSETWKRADREPPPHSAGTWSEEVICVTTLGRVFELCYSGVWQRTSAFLPGEEVAWWIKNPRCATVIDSDTYLFSKNR
jgi:hypothetical protein